MPVSACAAALWLGIAAAAEPAKAKATAAPDAELLEFLGSFETRGGQWPELNELLSARAPAPPPAATPPPVTRPNEETRK